MNPNETIYAGEAQLAGWSDTHTGGAKVTFWLPTAEDLEKFRALTVRKGNTAGHVVMLAVVEVGDGGKPEPPPPSAGMLRRGEWLCECHNANHSWDETCQSCGASRPSQKKNGPYCIEAIDLCRNPLFQRWVQQECFDEDQLKGEYMDYTPEQLAKEFILVECGVDSRKYIDGDDDAIKQFIDAVRVPFMHWQRELSE